MTDDEFEILWELQTRERSKPGFPDYFALQAFAATHPEGVRPDKLCRRFEAEGYTKGNVQLAIGRATDCGFLRNGPSFHILAGERTTPLEFPAP